MVLRSPRPRILSPAKPPSRDLPRDGTEEEERDEPGGDVVGDPEIGDQRNREVDVYEPGERIFPMALAQVSQGDVEAKRDNPDEAHERYGVMVQDNGFPSVGSSHDYNGEIPFGEQGGGCGWDGPLPRRLSSSSGERIR